MWARTESSSRVTRWCWLSRARCSRLRQASARSAALTSGRRWETVFSIQTEIAITSRPTCGSSSSPCAAFFMRSYSSSRRTSSARGSSSIGVALGGRGSSRRDLISISIAAITRYSAASSRLVVRIASTYSMYWRVSGAIWMSMMSRFSLRIRYKSRSRGPRRPPARSPARPAGCRDRAAGR